MASESRQTLRAVVGDGDTGHLLERAVWLGGVPHQLRRIPVDLVDKGASRRNPLIARSAADVSTKPPEGAIALDNRTCGILGDFEFEAVDVECGDVAVPENRSVQESGIGGRGCPAKFSDLSSPGVDRYNLADTNSAIFVDPAQGHSIADGICDDERIRPVMQEREIERRTAPTVLERGVAERTVCVHAEYNDAVGIWRIRSDGPCFAVWTSHPENG